jgi:hypothetical protein
MNITCLARAWCVMYDYGCVCHAALSQEQQLRERFCRDKTKGDGRAVIDRRRFHIDVLEITNMWHKSW